MRVLFYLPDTGAAYLALALAEDIGRTAGASSIAAVTRTEPTLRYIQRKGIADSFAPLIAEPEVFGDGRGGTPDDATLRELEAAYGSPTLWQYVTMDRYLSMRRQGGLSYKYGTDRSRDELLGYVVHGLQRVEALFDEFRPDLVVACGIDVSSSAALMIDRVAHARGVPFAVPMPIRVGTLALLNDTVYNRSGRFDERYRALREGGAESPHRDEAARRLEALRRGKNALPPSTHNYTGEPDRAGLPSRLAGAARAVGKEAVQVARNVWSRSWRDPRIAPPHERILDQRRVRKNRERILSSPLFSDGDPAERYVFCPLHLEPEMAQLLYAPFHTNQLEVVRNAAQSLPADTKLYVKDHTVLLGVRPWGYYVKLSRVPNVTLVRPTADTARLMAGAVGVVTVAGTAALEAALQGTPSLVLGQPIFAGAEDLVAHVPNYPDLPAAFRRFETDRPDPDAALDYVTAALDVGAEVSAYHLCQAALDLPPERVRDLEGYAEFWSLLSERVAEVAEPASRAAP